MTPEQIHATCRKMLASVPLHDLPGGICDAIREQRLTFKDAASVVRFLAGKLEQTQKQLKATEKKLKETRARQ